MEDWSRNPGSVESPFTPQFGDPRLQSGITRFQSQWVKTQKFQPGLLSSHASVFVLRMITR
jgi:hypothetical protein